MGAIALADFGSTYTKLSLVDPEEGRLLARAEAPTSIDTDLMEGYAAALDAAERAAGGAVEVEEALAASSAGGGLRVAAVGLVADRTGAAARQAALNAGARVGAVLAGALEPEQLDELPAARPEIVLFPGGTDGGQIARGVETARRLAAARLDAHFVVACNSHVAEEAAELLRAAGAPAEVAANVMPRLGELQIDAAREAILRAFLDHVIGGKGLSASPDFERMVRMPTPEAVLEATTLLSHGTEAGPGAGGGVGGVPTPEAVLEATTLLSHGTEAVPGVGDVMVVDVGGATTDVHSSRLAEAATPGVEEGLLPPPPTLRTVEGDLGLRSGSAGVIAADGRWIEAEADL